MFGKGKTVLELKNELQPFYKKQGSVYCKAIKDHIVFNMQGWRHLTYHSNGVRRDNDDLRMRLVLFRSVPSVVKNCKSVYKTTTETITVKGKKKEALHFEMHYSFNKGKYCLIVVLRKIGKVPESKTHYWTVRPCRKHKNSQNRELV